MTLDKLVIKSYPRFEQRFMGLMGRKSLPFDEGIVLFPCQSVHSFFMRFSICVLHCDHEGRLLKYVPCLRPWSWSICHKAYYVFEFNAGRFRSAEHARQWLDSYFNHDH